MSYEEDYLMSKVGELEARLAKLEASCPGSRSVTSTGSQPTNEQRKSESVPAPAPTTESPSKKDPEASSTAGSTDGSGTAERAVEGSERPEGTDYSAWSYHELLDELRKRDLPRGGNTTTLMTRLMNDDVSRTHAR